MPVNVVTTVNLGAVSLQKSEFLLYTLTAKSGIGLWAFGCKQGPKLASTDFANSPYEWQLGGNGPSVPGMRHVPLSQGENDPDRYVVDLSFATTPVYQLRVVKQPGSHTVQDISFESRVTADPADTRPSNTETFPQSLRVTLVKDQQ